MFLFPSVVSGSVFCNIGFVMVFIMLFEFFTGLFLSFKMCGGSLGLNVKLNFLNNTFGGCFIFKVHVLFPNFMAVLMLLHIFKSFVNFSSSCKEVVLSGFLLLVLFVGVSYTGYSLSKGSMGYWAVVVVNGLLKEGLGSSLSSSLFFYSSLGLVEDTFFKMFTYHFLLSFFIIILQFVHMFLLHNSGSSNFISSLYLDYFSFYIFMFVKDLFLVFMLSLSFLCFMFYSFLGLFGENFLEVNEFKALDLSVEWYVSMFFMVLSGVCYKSLGVLFTLIFLLVILLNFFIKDIFSLDSFMTLNFYIVLFVFNIFFMSLSYFGFSSCIFFMSLVLLMFLFFLLDGVFIKSFFNVIKF